MRVLPKSRGRRIALGVVVGLIAVTAPLWWEPLLFGAKLAVPAPAYDAADGRSSDVATIGDDVDFPRPRNADGLEGDDDEPGRGERTPDVAFDLIVELDSPSAVADPEGDGPVLVSTLDGRLHAVDLGEGTSEVLLDVSSRISTGGERGLLGIAIDPDGERLYLDWTNGRGDTEIHSLALNRAGDAPACAEDNCEDDDFVHHLTIGQPFPNHNGGNLVFGPDGALWIATGDGGGAGDRGGAAQNVDSLLGKMLRVIPDPEGGVLAPSNNPDFDGRPEIWGIGLRNPWRWSFDRETDLLWIADVGQQSIEEVTVVAADRPVTGPLPNFGWNVVEGANDYKGEPSEDFIAPAITYGHEDGACSVTGGHVYRGAAIPDLYGWYLYSDFCAGWVRGAYVDGDDVLDDSRPLDTEEIAAGVGAVISFGELEDGELVVLTREGILSVSAG